MKMTKQDYLTSLVLAYVAAPGGTEEEEWVAQALEVACVRAGVKAEEMIQAVTEAHGGVISGPDWNQK